MSLEAALRERMRDLRNFEAQIELFPNQLPKGANAAQLLLETRVAILELRLELLQIERAERRKTGLTFDLGRRSSPDLGVNVA